MGEQLDLEGIGSPESGKAVLREFGRGRLEYAEPLLGGEESADAGPAPPGVRVTIRSRDRGSWYTWAATLDGVPHDSFWAFGCKDGDGNPFRSPEDAEADCREKVTELVARLLPDLNREDIELTFDIVRE